MGAGQLSKAHLLLSARDSVRLQSQKALGLCLLMICSGLLALSFMTVYTPRIDSFILIVETAFAALGLAVSLLLFAQFPLRRSPAVLVLASGFLFVALATLPQLLRIAQGANVEAQLRFTADLALPLAVIVYMFLRRVERPLEFDAGRSAALIGRAVAATFALAALAVWLSTTGDGPDATANADVASSIRDALATAFLAIVIGVAIGVLWRQRHAPLDLWLLVTLTAWLIAVLIQGISPVTSFAWHFAQLYPLLGMGCMLLALLPADPVAQRAEAERAEEQGPVATDSALGAVANELNQSLCAISANAEAIARLLPGDAPREIRAALEDITGDTQRMSRTVSAAQRLLAGVNEPPAVIDVGQLVNECVQQLQSELREHAVVCDVETAPHLPGVRGLRQPLVQLLVNVLTNSLEAMSGVNSRERRLTVRASRQDPDTVVISVQDSGAGMGRSGPGLALCRSIADAHGGNIVLAPGDGSGTAIKVILPASS